MKERLEALLRELFAPDLVEAIAPRLSALVHQYRNTIQPPVDEYDPQLPLDETDLFLRVHEDQFVGDSGKPSALLHEFLTTQLEGIVKGVYVLPAGSSADYIHELAREYRVMVDLVPAQGAEQRQEPDYSNPEVVAAAVEALLRHLADGVSVVRLTMNSQKPGTAEMSGPWYAGMNAVARLSRALMAELAPWCVLVTDAAAAVGAPTADANAAPTADANADADAHMVSQHELAPLMLEAMVTGSAEALRCWARALPKLPSATAYLNLVPSELKGNFLDSVTDPALPVQQRARVFLCAQTAMLSLAGVPGVDTECLIASGGGEERPLEFSKMVEELEDSGSLRNVVFEGYKTLLRARSLEPLCHPTVPQKVLDLHPAVFALLRSSSQNNGEGMLCIHNLSLDPVELMFSPAEFGLDIEIGMREIIGGDIVFPSDEPGGLVSLEVDSYEVLWLRTPVHLDTDENRAFMFEDDDFPVEAAELEDQED